MAVIHFIMTEFSVMSPAGNYHINACVLMYLLLCTNYYMTVSIVLYAII